MTGSPQPGWAVRGTSTYRTGEQASFADAEGIPFPLLSDTDLALTAALWLPTSRAAGQVRLRRVVLVVGAERRVEAVRHPVTDIPDTVRWARTVLDDERTPA